MSARTYAIIGNRRLGGFYGARLHRAGIDVHFLLHTDYEHVRAPRPEGRVQGRRFRPAPGQRLRRRPRHAQVRCRALVALKTTQNHLLPDLLPPVLKEDGVVLILQNGLGIEDDVAADRRAATASWAACASCARTRSGPGHIRHLDYGAVAFADYSPDGQTARHHRPACARSASDFELRRHRRWNSSRTSILARWKKLVWNIPFNGLSVVLNATTDELMKNPEHARARRGADARGRRGRRGRRARRSRTASSRRCSRTPTRCRRTGRA